MDQRRDALIAGNRLPRWTVVALAALPATGLALFYAWPLVTLVVRVVRPGAIGDMLRAPGIAHVWWFTLWQAAVSTVLTLVIGFVPAYVLTRYRFTGRRFVLAAVTVPFMLPTVVVGAAFLAVLPDGWHGSARAVVVAHVFFNVAVVVRVVGAMWAVIPHDLTAAARTLGASPIQLLRHVVIPLLRPSLWAAASVVFLFTFTSFGIVTLLGGAANPTVEVEIARRATQLGDVGGAAVLSLLQLVVLGVVLGVSSRWQRRGALELTGRSEPRTVARGPRKMSVYVTSAVLGVTMLLPVVSMAASSVRLGGRWSLQAWRTLGSSTIRGGVTLSVDPLASLFASLRFAVVATVIAVVAGWLAAQAIVTARRHGRLLDVGLMLPLATSAVTIGFGMLITFDRAPFDWRARWWLVPLGHAMVATPFVVRALLPPLRSIPADRTAAAATLGASPLRAWWWVTARPSLRPTLQGAGFAAAISLGEFGATTVLTRAGRETMPIAIGRLLGRAGAIPRAQGFALATILFMVTAAIIVAADRPLGDRDARRR